jgi:hypothetical protein
VKEKEIYQHCLNARESGKLYFCRFRTGKTVIFNTFDTCASQMEFVATQLQAIRETLTPYDIDISIYTGRVPDFISYYEANNQ